MAGLVDEVHDVLERLLYFSELKMPLCLFI